MLITINVPNLFVIAITTTVQYFSKNLQQNTEK